MVLFYSYSVIKRCGIIAHVSSFAKYDPYFEFGYIHRSYTLDLHVICKTHALEVHEIKYHQNLKLYVNTCVETNCTKK